MMGCFFTKTNHTTKAIYMTESAFIKGCEDVIQRVEQNRVNEAGLKLQEEFTYEKTVEQILNHLESV